MIFRGIGSNVFFLLLGTFLCQKQLIYKPPDSTVSFTYFTLVLGNRIFPHRFNFK